MNIMFFVFVGCTNQIYDDSGITVDSFESEILSIIDQDMKTIERAVFTKEINTDILFDDEIVETNELDILINSISGDENDKEFTTLLNSDPFYQPIEN